MDFLRRNTGRRAIAVATAGLLAIGFGGACQAQDGRGAMSQPGYSGPYLSWSGKQSPAPDAARDEGPPAAELSEARYAPAPDYQPNGYAPQAPHAASPPGDDSESRYGPSPRYAP